MKPRLAKFRTASARTTAADFLGASLIVVCIFGLVGWKWAGLAAGAALLAWSFNTTRRGKGSR